MAIYAIGDIQGCFRELLQLLKTIHFNADRDQLWFTGDLVNRGPQSLEVLRFVKQLGDQAITVLGNHDLHLLAVSQGHKQYHLKKEDTMDEVLHAPDRDALLDWLRQLPFMHRDHALGFTLIHAGLPPQWDLDLAAACAQEVEFMLQSDQFSLYLQQMYGNEPEQWSPGLGGWDRLRFITNCFTRLRYCDADGRMALEEKGALGSQAAGLAPWFRIPSRATKDDRIIFGHWSTLGACDDPNVYPIDTGCLWGGRLTALRIDAKDSAEAIAIDCPQARTPG